MRIQLLSESHQYLRTFQTAKIAGAFLYCAQNNEAHGNYFYHTQFPSELSAYLGSSRGTRYMQSYWLLARHTGRTVSDCKYVKGCGYTFQDLIWNDASGNRLPANIVARGGSLCGIEQHRSCFDPAITGSQRRTSEARASGRASSPCQRTAAGVLH